jgi:hypothetical protein
MVFGSVNKNETWSQRTEFISVISHFIKFNSGADAPGAGAGAGPGPGESSSLEQAVALPR